MPQYTLMDLEEALDRRKAVEEQWAKYRGGGPNKLLNERLAASAAVIRIEEDLRTRGELARNARAILEAELNQAYPDAQTKQVVEHNGRRFERRHVSAGLSPNGKTNWTGYWVEIPSNMA